ncbi:uncharacterized protein LOC110435686 isoform X2 [Sorghum bicolor]|uniref:uncharacterized protein LOC110435686 isoform X2 n=1 Tax=Sorghum bicolor TaxID=4558 RepID=UPI000B424E1D|nr:uncharacterized protein LOC110435686 isoform X2 [Sorghum bicolor]|eukprot:XP_021317266.1 uncharacterized protein LOC110435686 isoform X2 [Sorghum bicolor]
MSDPYIISSKLDTKGHHLEPRCIIDYISFSLVDKKYHINATTAEPNQRSLCKWKGMLAEGATSPTVFKSKQVSATSNELVNSIAMGKCLSTIAIQVGTSVLSEDPSQVRKLIMSLWVSDIEKFQQPKVFTHAPDTRNTSLPAPVQLLVIW